MEMIKERAVLDEPAVLYRIDCGFAKLVSGTNSINKGIRSESQV